MESRSTCVSLGLVAERHATEGIGKDSVPRSGQDRYDRGPSLGFLVEVFLQLLAEAFLDLVVQG